ncbi:MAG TPA: 2-oxo-4-hydroxy-4-carboxy-5-ureidoimidazoline decarboxylase, partial [Polyangiales bacterium]|nr:2-oxo-4-hydroxy-4-carboxy-5-ureidoimidazoline decarboxylase [Polyangiales bacterium]
MSLEPHALLNSLPPSAAGEALARCCGSRRWIEGMLAARPYPSTPALLELADRVWSGLGEADVLEAFSQHPQIGANLEELQRKFAATATWSASEQSGAASASADTLLELRAL